MGLRHSSNSGGGGDTWADFLVGEQEPREREREGVISGIEEWDPSVLPVEEPAFPRPR